VRRREFISLLGGAAAWPLVARGQQAGRLRRIGIIAGGGPTPAFAGFARGMGDLGYIEGRDFAIEWRFAEGNYERHREFAADLLRQNVDVIVLGTTSALPAVRQITSTTPIVLAYSVDPVGNGFVASLARPGGNITGMASALDEIVSKHVGMLKEMVPNLSHIGLLSNSASPNHRSFVSGAQAAAQQARIDLVRLDATNQQEIETAFATATAQHAGAICVLADGLFNLHKQQIAELARVSMLPSIFSQREYAVAGGLISYGESLTDIFRRVAYFVDKILKGVKPADLPVEQPTKFELVVNLKTAKALGLTVPLGLQQRADELIE
jgi:putative tryptophan/tyrosine transport system substrate-binding protein